MVAPAAKRVLWGAGTTRTLRAHWMLQELGLDHETRAIGSRTGETQTPEFTALNPRQKIPVLEDGDFVLTESAAIVSYLGETYGAGRDLVPSSGTRERARYDEWCFFVMTELDAHTLYVIRKHRDLAELYGEAPRAVEAAERGFAKQVAVAERALALGGPYLLGEAFTGADVLLTSCLIWARFYALPLSDALDTYLSRTTDREAYRRALERNFPSGAQK
jgi:glutathione S-transferase